SISPSRSLLFLAGIVAAARAHGKLLVRLGMCIDVDGPESGDTLRSRRAIGDGVLIPNILGNRAADILHLIERWWEKRYTARALGNQFQGALRLSRLFFSE